jgi:hypothetical protein
VNPFAEFTDSEGMQIRHLQSVHAARTMVQNNRNDSESVGPGGEDDTPVEDRTVDRCAETVAGTEMAGDLPATSR